MAHTGPSESKTSKRRLSAAERQLQALELRKSGMSFPEIARRLDYAGPAGAYKAVAAALKATIQEPADDVRQLELERLDAMIDAAWSWAKAGSDKHIGIILRIMERRAALLGLDSPKRVDMSVTVRQEVERIAAEMGLDPAEVLAEADAILKATP